MTGHGPDGTTVTQLYYLESRLTALEATIARDIVTVRELQRVHADAHQREHHAVEAAITKAEQALSIRLEAMNEFRRQIDQERGTYVTASRLDDKIAAVREALALEITGIAKGRDDVLGRLGSLESALANMQGRAAAAMIGLTVAMFLVSLVVGVVLRLIQ